MVGWKSLGNGIELSHTTKEEKIKLAQESVGYNLKHNKHLIEQFNNQTFHKLQQLVGKLKVPKESLTAVKSLLRLAPLMKDT